MPKAIIIIVCAMGLGFVVFTHYYRPPLKDQFPGLLQRQESGLNNGLMLKGQHVFDSFSFELYQEIGSVDDAVYFLQTNYPHATEEELVRLTSDLVGRRFFHYMYPQHTYLTNPLLAVLGKIMPRSSFDAMYLPEDLLRHAAGASCGQAAAVFIAIWRRLGGKARAYHLKGHDIAEAKVNGKLWMVDSDLGGIAPYSIQEIRRNPDFLEEAYSGLNDADMVDSLKTVFTDPDYWHYGFDEPPSTSPRIYMAQMLINYLKFAFFPLLALGLLLIIRLRNKSNQI